MKKILLLIVLGGVVYSGSLSGGFLWDDNHLIVGNEWLREPGLMQAFLEPSLPGFTGYYRPVQLLSYKLDYFIWGNNPFGYHLSNVLLHLCNAVLVFLLFSRIIPRHRHNENAAFAGAVLFCIHPLLSETVNYLSSRSDLLFTLFSLLAFTCFLKYRTQKRGWLGLSAGFFLSALLSKEAAIVFPLVLTVYLWLFSRDRMRSLIPYFVIAVLYLAARGAAGAAPEAALPGRWAQLLMTDACVYAHLLRLVFLPLGLHKDWFLPLVTRVCDPAFLVSLVFLMLFIFLSLKYAQARRRVLFGLLWAAVFLMPASSLLIFSLLAVGETVSHTVVSESWAYPACAGIFFIAGDIGQKLYRLLPRKIVCGGFLAVMIALGALTIERNSIWAGDAVLFYRQILTFQPRNSVVYYNMGNEYLARGSHAEAEEAYLKALTLNPQYLYARNNLCNLYVRTGRFEEAVRECQRVIAQAPGLTRAYVNLENAYTAVRRRKQ